MAFTLHVGQVNLTKTQELGLVHARESIWRLAINQAVAAIEKRGLSQEHKSRCLHLLEKLSSRHAAVSADKAVQTSESKSIFFVSYKVLHSSTIPNLISKEINSNLDFLSSYESPLWNSPKVKEAAHIMADVFRNLLLCRCAWMQNIPVAVIAAIVEVFATNADAFDAKWWLDKEQCGRVRQRAITLCGPNADTSMTDSVRAAFVLLVLGMRYAERVNNRCRIDEEGYPFGAKAQSLPHAAKRRRVGESVMNDLEKRLFLTEKEVRKLLAVVKKVEWNGVYERVRADLDMQCAIVKEMRRGDASKEAKDNKTGDIPEVNNWCFYCEETGEIRVSCAMGMVMEVGEVVRAMAGVAAVVKKNERYQNLVERLGVDGEAVALPFLLAQVLTEGLERGITEKIVGTVTESLLQRISNEGGLQTIKRGPKSIGKKGETREKGLAEKGLENDGTNGGDHRGAMERQGEDTDVGWDEGVAAPITKANDREHSETEEE